MFNFKVTNVKRVNASLEERLEEVLGAPTGGTERVDGGGRDDLQVLTSRVSELEDSNAALRRELKVAREEEERVRDYEEVQRQLKEATESVRLLKAEVRGNTLSNTDTLGPISPEVSSFQGVNK